ncbi:hypothetical protein [Pyrobaculum islandicum]|uniref:hypothetical protein n=1 Tax=Pyrobaculum islandicum TaxID=2277 RepID=UPI000B0D9E69
MARTGRGNAAREIIKLARERQAAVVVDAVEESYRELKEGSGEKKHLLDGLGQLKRRSGTAFHM